VAAALTSARIFGLSAASCSRCFPENGPLKVTPRRTPSRAFWSTSPIGPCCLPPPPPAAPKLLKRCLEKDLSRRLRDIGDARLELEDVQSLSPSSSGSMTADERLQSRARRRWRTLTAVAWAFIVGAAMAVVWQLRTRQPSPPNPLENALFSRVTNFEGTERSAAISRDGRFVAYRSDRDGPLDVWMTQIGTGQFFNVTKGIDDEFAIDTPSCGFSDGSEIWLSGGVGRRLRLLPLMGGTPRPFLPDSTVSVAWSPDGTRVVYHLQDKGDSVFVAAVPARTLA
jgi:hypothetical protein